MSFHHPVARAAILLAVITAVIALVLAGFVFHKGPLSLDNDNDSESVVGSSSTYYLASSSSSSSGHISNMDPAAMQAVSQLWAYVAQACMLVAAFSPCQTSMNAFNTTHVSYELSFVYTAPGFGITSPPLYPSSSSSGVPSSSSSSSTFTVSGNPIFDVSASVIVDLDSESLSASASGPLTMWNDSVSSAAFTQSVSGKTPSFNTNGYVTFDGWSGSMIGPSIFPVSSDYTIMVCLSMIGGTGGQIMVGSMSATNGHAFYLQESDGQYMPQLAHGNPLTAAVANAVVDIGVLTTLAVTWTSASLRPAIYVNGNPTVLFPYSLSDNTDPTLCLGAWKCTSNGGAIDRIHADFFGVTIFSSALGAGDISSLHSIMYDNAAPHVKVRANHVPAYFPQGWGSTYFNTLSPSRLTRIGILGDSVSAGSCASNQYPTSAGTGYVQRLTTRMQTMFGDGGSGFQSPTSNPSNPGNGAYSTNQLPVQVSGFVLNTYQGGSTDATFFTAYYAPNSFIQFYVRGSNLVVYYFMGPGYGQFSVSVNGTVITTISPGFPTTVLQSSSFAIAAGEHTVVITSLSSDFVAIVGVSATNAHGVVIDNMSVPGLALTSVSTSTAYGNPFNNTDGGVPGVADLMIIMMGLNDASSGANAALFNQSVKAAIQSYQAAGVKDILFILPPGGDAAYDTSDFEAYRVALFQTAAAMQFGFIDMGYLLNWDYDSLCSQGFYAYSPTPRGVPCVNPFEASTSLADCNGVHPGDVGHNRMANAIYPFLTSASNAMRYMSP